jgi:hypothetical protein
MVSAFPLPDGGGVSMSIRTTVIAVASLLIGAITSGYLISRGYLHFFPPPPPPTNVIGNGIYMVSGYNTPSPVCELQVPILTLRRIHHETVNWFSDDGHRYSVVFGDSPFLQHASGSPPPPQPASYQVSSPAPHNPGVPHSSSPYGYYRYSIHILDNTPPDTECKSAAGDPTTDPGIKIRG